MEHDPLICPSTAHAPTVRPSAEAIREQLERLVASPRFATSPRCQILLRHIVEEALKGNTDSLKERNIGIEVFRRDPAYDTNADPAVRVAASEIRKKLAQYYYEPGNQDQIRIALPTGAYAPLFSLPEALAGSEASTVSEPASAHPERLLQEGAAASAEHVGREAHDRATATLRRVRLLVAGVCLLAIAGAAIGWRIVAARNPVALFWAPLLQSKSPVLLCTGEIGSQHGTFPAPAVTASGPVMAMGPNGVYSRELITVVFDDVVLLTELTAKLRSDNKPYVVRYESITTFEDLLKGPAVLIGSYNNAWSMHFTRSMRYSFEHDSDYFLWIADKEKPGLKLGMQRVNQEIYGTEEYAVVARLVDTEARQPALIIAGVTPTATRAVGQFVTNAQTLGDYLKTLPRNWQNKNLEILFKVHVVDNQAGPPQVVTQTIW